MQSRENEMVDALVRSLPPGSVRLDRSDRRVDAVAVLPDGSSLPLTFKWAGEGYPRDVDRVLQGGMQVEPDTVPARAETIVFARAFSDNAVALLRERGLSWVALDGSASLHLGTVWVERDRQFEVDAPAERDFAWTTARLEIAEALLSSVARALTPVDERPGVPRIEELKQKSGRSLGAVAKTLAEFDRAGWTSPGKTARSRVLTDGPGLLDSWSAWVAGHHEPWTTYHSLHRDPGRIVQALRDAVGTEVLFSGLTASQLVVPTTTSAPVVNAYVIRPLDGWQDVERRLEEHDIRPSASGVIRLAESPTVVSAFAEDRTGLRTPSSVRIYADLLEGTSRGVEAAEAFRAATLGSLG